MEDKRKQKFIEKRKKEYETGFYNPVSFDKKYESIYSLLDTSELDKKTKLKKYILGSKTIPIKRTISILENYFNFHDILMSKEEQQNDIISERLIQEDNILTINPFSLPIKYISGEDYYGEVTHSLTYYNVFYNIYLGKKITDITTPIYAHELTHTQCDTLSTIKNYKNSELLPIFIELLTSHNINNETLREMIRKRLKELRSNIRLLKLYTYSHETNYKNNEFINSLEASKYLISTLKAYNLFYTYLNLSEEEQKIMIKRINLVLNNEKTLDDLLKDYNINEDSSKNNEIVYQILKKGGFYGTK